MITTRSGQNIARYSFGLIACGMAIYFLLAHRQEPIIFFASLFLLVICATDTLHSRIPNLAVLTLLLIGLGYHIQVSGVQEGGVMALAGMGTGLALLLVPYLMGGMGGGDVKAMAALGALLGPADILQVFLFTSLLGGVIALIYMALNRELVTRIKGLAITSWLTLITRRLPAKGECTGEKDLKYPYGTAIAFGFFAFISWGGLF